MSKDKYSFNNLDVQIFDDLLESRYLFDLHNRIQECNYTFDVTGGNRDKFPPGSHEGEYRFWGCTVMERIDFATTINRSDVNLFKQLWNLFSWINKEKYNNSLFCHRIHINGQTIGQDGGIHLDDSQPNPYSLMLFPYFKWNPEWGGDFQIVDKEGKDAKVLETIKYVPGRFIGFDGNLWHRGLAPLIPNILRTSVVWKCQRL